MSVQTSASGGPNSAAAGGASAGGQSGHGDSQRVTGDAASGATASPGGVSAVNLTAGDKSPQTGGLAKVFAGSPEAGEERVTGGAASGATASPDQAGNQPKGEPETKQSNDNLSLPAWAQQLPKKQVEKLAADPNLAASLSAYKSLDEFVMAHLVAATKPDNGQQLSIPGKDSTPEEVQAFYERLGRPKDAGGYSFAKSEPALAAAAFAANLSGDQADALYRASMVQLDDARKGIQAALAQDFAATDVLLQKEYGERYDEALALMQRGLGNNPSTGALSPVAKALADAGLAGKPEIVRAFIELGRATSEGTAAPGSMGAPQPESVMNGRGFAYKDSYS